MKATRDEVHQIRDFAEQEGLALPLRRDPEPAHRRRPRAARAATVAGRGRRDRRRRRAAPDEFADYLPTRVGSAARQTTSVSVRRRAAATFLIDPYGKMHVCELSRRPGWDVLRDGFAAGFGTAFAAVLDSRSASDMGGCGSCPTGGVCSNCIGMAELEARSIRSAATRTSAK